MAKSAPVFCLEMGDLPHQLVVEAGEPGKLLTYGGQIA
jgi:hypothetical protein